MKADERARRRRSPFAVAVRLAWLNTVAGSTVFPSKARTRLLRLAGVHATGAGVWSHVRFISGSEVTIGDGSFVSSGVVFDAGERIRIGERVAIGPNTLLLTSSHEIGPPGNRAGDGATTYAPIEVEDGTWIGGGAIVLAGVTIGRGCVIGAGAVVIKDCEPNGLYLGVPARRVRDLPVP